MVASERKRLRPSVWACLGLSQNNTPEKLRRVSALSDTFKNLRGATTKTEVFEIDPSVKTALKMPALRTLKRAASLLSHRQNKSYAKAFSKRTLFVHIKQLI